MLARFDGGSGEHDALDLTTVQCLDRGRDGEVALSLIHI